MLRFIVLWIGADDGVDNDDDDIINSYIKFSIEISFDKARIWMEQ